MCRFCTVPIAFSKRPGSCNASRALVTPQSLSCSLVRFTCFVCFYLALHPPSCIFTSTLPGLYGSPVLTSMLSCLLDVCGRAGSIKAFSDQSPDAPENILAAALAIAAFNSSGVLVSFNGKVTVCHPLALSLCVCVCMCIRRIPAPPLYVCVHALLARHLSLFALHVRVCVCVCVCVLHRKSFPPTT